MLFKGVRLQFVVAFVNKLGGKFEDVELLFLRKIPSRDKLVNALEVSENNAWLIDFNGQVQNQAEDLVSEAIFI